MKSLSIILITLFVSCGRHVLTKQEMQSLNNRQKKCEDAVTLWIKNHALYPDSYTSLGFKEYSEAAGFRGKEKVPNSESYSIFHTHKMKTIHGDTAVFSGYFILENDYFMDIIKTEKTNSMGGAYPPETEIWLSRFGRPLNAKDSAELNDRQQKLLDKTLDELKNANYENESDKEKVMKMLDTIHKK